MTDRIHPQPGPQEQFLSTSADIALYGGGAGSGKTFALLMEAARHAGNKHYRAAIFRRTYPEITEPGALWDEALRLYPMMGAEPQIGNLKFTFPSGAQIQFLSCQYEADLMKYQGMQVAFLGFDELTHFRKKQFFYLISRNRSVSGIRPYVRATCNPDDCWLAEFIAWWVDQETGYPIPERAGVVRWFIHKSNEVYWADTPGQLVEEHGEEFEPKSFTFFPALLEDNKILMEKDPGYEANLKSLPHVEQERLLKGNWKISDNEGAYWANHPEYFGPHLMVDEIPDSFEVSCIAIDPSLGRSEKSDFTAIVFVGVSGGLLWIDAIIERLTETDLAERLIDQYLIRRPDFVGCETNGFQSLLDYPIQDECQRRGLPPLSVHEYTNTVDKMVRIKRLGPDLSAKRLRILNNEGGQEMYRQLRSFGIADHDDGPDALESGRQMLFDLASYNDDIPEVEIAY